MIFTSAFPHLEFWKVYFEFVHLLEAQVMESDSPRSPHPKTPPKVLRVCEPIERNRILIAHYSKDLPVQFEFESAGSIDSKLRDALAQGREAFRNTIFG